MAEITVQRAAELALQHQQAGRRAEAEAIFRPLQDAAGDNPVALFELGVAAYQATLGDTALRLFRRVVALQPDMAEAHNYIGTLLHSGGQIADALESFQLAAACKPGHVDYLFNAASSLRALGRAAEAVDVLKQIIVRSPALFAAHFEMGRALEAQGQNAEAIDSYRRALALQPRFVPALHHLGIALGTERRFDEAIEVLARAVQLRPGDPKILTTLARGYEGAQRFAEATAAFQRAMELQPADADSLCRQGTALGEKAMYDRAIPFFQRALAVQPDHVAANCNLALAMQHLGGVNEAIPLYKNAMRLAPDNPGFHASLLFAMLLSDSVSPDESLQEHQRWAERFADPLAGRIPVHGNDRSPERILHVGYVSPDLHEHPVAAFLLPILESHDRRQFHVTCYSNSWLEDEMTARLRAAAQVWHNTSDWSDERLAAQIGQDRIDILIDLAQHCGGSRMLLFARKPAPVQVTYLGYPSTTGLKTFDARLSDPYIDPPGQTERFSTEPIARLPETYWCFRPLPDAPPVQTPPAIAAGYITFGCLNKLAKVSPSALRLWSAILRKVPESRLLLSAPPGGHRQRILDIFRTERVAAERIEFIEHQPFHDYLTLYHRLDIALDPFPYNGGTTTCQALWMGVPVVTLAGIAGVQRSGVSLLTNAGFPELVAGSPEQYVQIAADLAGDLPRLSSMRQGLRDRMSESPLMDVPRFVGNLEAIYRRLWRDWCNRS